MIETLSVGPDLSDTEADHGLGAYVVEAALSPATAESGKNAVTAAVGVLRGDPGATETFVAAVQAISE